MNNKVYIGTIVLLLAILGYMAVLLNRKNETIVYIDRERNAVMDERDMLTVDLEEMRMAYDTLETDNAEMLTKIAEQQEELDALIKKVRNRDYDISKLKKEAETLRSIMKGYIHQIDELQQANERLTIEKDAASQRATKAETRSKELETDLTTQKDIISKGSILSTGGFANIGINLRSNGKQVETEKANRAEMIKSCFTVRKNAIVKPGTKTLSLRIIGPDGQVLPGRDSGVINIDGNSEPASVSREIDYQNQDTDVCVYYTSQGALTKGSYKIHIYESNNLIGQTELVLK
jgi:FtsZ-binding cell division protein ZapB